MSSTYIGRRKCAVALVRFVKGNGDFIINGKTGFSYLQDDPFAIQTVVAPLKLINLEKKYNIICSVRGGGICAQAEAVQLGIARALCSITEVGKTSNIPMGQGEAKLNVPSPSRSLQGASSYRRPQVVVDKQSSPQDQIVNRDSATRAELNQAPRTGRQLLKQQGYLRRDSRIKERRKYGLKKARKAEQYSKR